MTSSKEQEAGSDQEQVTKSGSSVATVMSTEQGVESEEGQGTNSVTKTKMLWQS